MFFDQVHTYSMFKKNLILRMIVNAVQTLLYKQADNRNLSVKNMCSITYN